MPPAAPLAAQRRRRSGLTLAICGLLALAGGCVPENEMTHELTESEYRQWANRYCAKQEAEIKDIPPPKGPKDLVRWVEKAFERTELNARRVKLLDPPSDLLQSHHDRASDLAQQDMAETKGLIETKRSGDARAAARRLRKVRRTTPLTRELVGTYGALGLDHCARLYTPVEEPGARAPRAAGEPPTENIQPEPGSTPVCLDLAATIREERDNQRSWAEEVRAEGQTLNEIEREVRTYPESRAKAEPDLKESKRLLKEAEHRVSNAEDNLEILAAEAGDQRCPR